MSYRRGYPFGRERTYQKPYFEEKIENIPLPDESEDNKPSPAAGTRSFAFQNKLFGIIGFEELILIGIIILLLYERVYDDFLLILLLYVLLT